MDLIGKKFGNFIVEKQIGGGGMGQVYRCQHPLLGRHAALKVLHEDLAFQADVVDRFFHEAKAANDIGNEHIVDVLDYGRAPSEQGDIVYLMMEFLEGESLGQRQRRAPLTGTQALHILRQCCEALQASHEKQIVHRDLKPENIFLCRRGEDPAFVKIVDFGIAKLTGDQPHQKTATGVLLGTPQYMSPEQCEGKGRVDHRSDIYSLGVVMYELFTGRVPFNETGVGEVLVGHMLREPPRPSVVRPEVPPEIEAVILHAMEKDRERRFQSMRELADALADPERHLTEYQQLPRAPTLFTRAGAAAIEVARNTPTVQVQPDRPTVHVEPTPVEPPKLRHTLSEAAAEMVAKPRPLAAAALPMVTALLGVVALGGVTLSVIFGVALYRRAPTARPAVVSVRVPDPAPVPSARVSVTIESEPSGATVTQPDRDQVVLGLTPLRLDLRRGEAPFVVQLRRAGYRDVTRVVVADGTKEVVVGLTHEPPPPPKPDAKLRDRRERLLLRPTL